MSAPDPVNRTQKSHVSRSEPLRTANVTRSNDVVRRELRLCGARVYEAQDFEEAIALAASGRLPLDRLITSVLPLEGLESGFREMESGGDAMKLLVKCSE